MNINNPLWGDKPYYSLNEYCKANYHEKLYKIALDAGFTCPNRDGTLDTRGCIFCSAGGSGEFAVKTLDKASVMSSEKTVKELETILPSKSVDEQIKEALSVFGNKKTGSRYIAYFQAYTNTYAPVSYLKQIYTQALSHPDIAGISVATRPDCLSDECIFLLTDLKQRYPDKFIWIELGLQTMHDTTAVFIRRGYPLSVFEQAMEKLTACGIAVIIHVILGLPGETDDMQYETISYLNRFRPFGIKLQLLHILKETDLAEYYLNDSNTFHPLTKEHYLNLLIGCIERLAPDIVIHRLTGDGPKQQLIAPLWSLNKKDVLNTLHKQMREQHSFQGKLYFDHNK